MINRRFVQQSQEVLVIICMGLLAACGDRVIEASKPPVVAPSVAPSVAAPDGNSGAMLVVSSDSPCKLSVNGVDKAQLSAADTQSVNVDVGQALVICESTLAKGIRYNVRQNVAVGSKSLLKIELAAKVNEYKNQTSATRAKLPLMQPQLVQDCSDCPQMVVIPAGSFKLGSTTGKPDEKNVIRVNLQSFAMGKTEVTQGQWKAVMGGNPSLFTDCGDTCPVENVSWNEVNAFIQKLNQQTNQHYRLPSEAEWEYACQAGGNHNYCGSDDADSVGWYVKNSGAKTHPVAGKQPNAFGLYDMSGNVYEWVQDWYHESYKDAPTDGSAWERGGENKYRSLRGGSWGDNPAYLRSSARDNLSPVIRGSGLGFRLARSAP